MEYQNEILHKYNKRGFSLIELLIVIVTMALLFQLSFSNFRDFSRRRVLDNAANQILSDLRLVQEYSRAGRKPSICGTNQLQYYRFNSNGASSYYYYPYCINVPHCNPGSPGEGCVVRNLATGVLINMTSQVDYLVLGRGTNGAPATITLTYDGMTRQIEVQDGGNIQRL